MAKKRSRSQPQKARERKPAAVTAQPIADEPPPPPPVTQTVRKTAVLCPQCGTAAVTANGHRGGVNYYVCDVCTDPESLRPLTFKVRVDRRLSATLPDGAWRERTVWIIGGGRSSWSFDPSLVRRSSDRVIAINDAWTVCRDRALVALQFSGDQAFWKAHRRDTLFRQSVGLCAALDHGKVPGFALTVPTHDEPGHWARTFEDGVRWGQNSGVSALNLADVLGAETVKLVGFDLDGCTRDGEHHSELEDMHRLFLDRFAEIAPKVRARVLVHGSLRSPLRRFWGDA